MNAADVMNSLTDIFRDILDEEDLVISEGSMADDVEEWDSLTHIQLIVAIEKFFNIKFTTNEIHDFKNVGDMCQMILLKKSS